MSTIATVWDNPSAGHIRIPDLDDFAKYGDLNSVHKSKKYDLTRKSAAIVVMPLTLAGYTLFAAATGAVIASARVYDRLCSHCTSSSTACQAMSEALGKATLADLKNWLEGSPEEIVNAIKAMPLSDLSLEMISREYVRNGGSLVTAIPTAFTAGMEIVENEMAELLESGRVLSKEQVITPSVGARASTMLFSPIDLVVGVVGGAALGAAAACLETGDILNDTYNGKTSVRRVADFIRGRSRTLDV